MKHFLVFILIFFSLSSFSQTYKGTIGKYPIYLYIEAYDDGTIDYSSYFYESTLQDIPLSGEIKNSKIFMYDRWSSLETFEELFTLEKHEDKLVGIWIKDDKVLEVNLIEVDIDTDSLKYNRLKLERDSVENYGNKQLVWFTEKYSKKSLFRLGNGFTKRQREFLNPKLDTLQYNYALTGLECSAEYWIETELINDTMISFYEYSDIYCGGAHPSLGIVTYNFDIKNLKILEDLNEIYPKLNIFKVLKNKYQDDDDLQDECEYFTDKSRWDYYNWLYTKEGIEIIPYFPHVLTPCKIPFLLTYKELKF